MMILVLLITLPIILIYLLHKNRKPAKALVPPGPPGLPLIGNLHQFGTATNIHVYLWQLSNKYGPLMHMKLAHVPLVVISSARLAKQVLKTQDLAFCSRPKLLGQQKLTYNGVDIVFSPYNDYWREMRRITSIHLFSLKKVVSFRPIREDEISRMVTKISSFASSGDQVVNLSEIAMGLASTLICRIAFGTRYDEHGSEVRRFDHLLHEAQAMAATFFVSDYFPSFSWVDKLTGLVHRLDEVCQNLDSFYQELIDDHLNPNRAKPKDDEEDILDILIKLKQQNSSSLGLGWDHVKALLTDIFVAGTDTTAASITWIMTALIKTPIVMEKVQAEIRNLVGTRKGKVDEDDLPNLPYLKAVINETFRLYPSVPILVPRETTERCILEGYEIQPKTLVYVNAWAVARDPDYWQNPEEFLPERFLNNNIDIKGQDFGVIPFGSGRRSCPGMFMGLANVELTLANLLYSFDWILPPGIQPQDVDMDALPGIAMHKKNSLFLVPKGYAF